MMKTKIVKIALISLFISLIIITCPVAADAPSRAGLVVQFEDGHVETRCVEFTEAEITGFELLARSGLDIIYESGAGMGGTVCQIEYSGCDYPSQPCFCQCPGGPTCTYWIYWHLKDDAWEYSLAGAGGYAIQNGAVDGWAWGAGSPTGGAEPPLIDFETICAQSPPPREVINTLALNTPLVFTDTGVIMEFDMAVEASFVETRQYDFAPGLGEMPSGKTALSPHWQFSTDAANFSADVALDFSASTNYNGGNVEAYRRERAEWQPYTDTEVNLPARVITMHNVTAFSDWALFETPMQHVPALTFWGGAVVLVLFAGAFAWQVTCRAAFHSRRSR